MTSNATPIEVAYTAVMLFGLITSIANALWAHARVQELRRSGQNGVLKVMREGARSDQVKISLAFLFLAAIGLISMLTPPNPYVTTNGVVSGVCFIGVGLTLVWKSVSVRRRPADLRHALADAQSGSLTSAKP